MKAKWDESINIEEKIKIRTFAKTLSLLIILILAVFLFSHLFFAGTFEGPLNQIEQYVDDHRVAGKFIFIGLAAVSAMLSFFSSVPMVPFAVAIWGKEITLVLLLVGWLLGGFFSYLVGKHGAYLLIKFIKKSEKIEYYRGKLESHLDFLVVFLFRLAMPAEIPGYVLGILNYNLSKYMVATFLAELPFAIITIYASGALLTQQPLFSTALIIAGAAIILIALKIFYKRIQ